MQNKALHIISFDNPFPPKYGGVIDVFYKIKALHSLGVKIYLHCFVDEIPMVDSDLKIFVEKVYYYKNRKSILSFFSLNPFSVSYRNHSDLFQNLKGINAPIIFESLKTTSLIKSNTFSQRTILRLHNIEHEYFLGISKSESNWLKKILYYVESLKYKKYESILYKFDEISTLSCHETDYVSENFKKANYVPLFHGNQTIKNLSSFGDFAIYNGDLRTSDNRKAVLFLIDIFKEIKDYELVIVATDKQDWVEKLIKSYNNIKYIKCENFDHLKELLSIAHINIMMSFQESGTKLKAINGLFNSRHCLVNSNMIDDREVLKLCKLAETKDEFIKQISILRQEPYEDFEKRKRILKEVLDDTKNAISLMKIINNTNLE